MEQPSERQEGHLQNEPDHQQQGGYRGKNLHADRLRKAIYMRQQASGE